MSMTRLLPMIFKLLFCVKLMSYVTFLVYVVSFGGKKKKPSKVEIDANL